MKGQANREPEKYLAKLRQYDRPLQLIYAACLIIVWFGSLYGMHEMLLSHFSGASGWTWLAAGVFSLLVQSLNMVAVSFSMQMLAAAAVWLGSITNKERNWLAQNTYQTFGGIGVFIGIGGLCATTALCLLDFATNKVGNHRAAEQAIARPKQEQTDTSSHAMAVKMASMAVNAEKQAEAIERRAFEAKIDAEINAQRSKLADRKAHLAKISPRPNWVTVELGQIETKLNNLESRRAARKREFVPVKSNLMEKQRELAATSGQQSRLLMSAVAVSDSIYTQETYEYINLKGSLKSGMMVAYIIALLLMHFVDLVYWWLAFRYDVKEDDEGDSLLQSYKETIADLLKNCAWWLLSALAWLKPERPVQRHGRTKIAEIVASNPYSEDVLRVVLQNPQITEVSIYMKMRERLGAAIQAAPKETKAWQIWRKSPTAVLEFQKALSALAECGLVTKINGRFSVNPDQAQHFFDLNKMQTAQNFTTQSTGFQDNSSNFGGDNAAKQRIFALISDYQTIRAVSPTPQAIDQLIKDYNTILSVM